MTASIFFPNSKKKNDITLNSEFSSFGQLLSDEPDVLLSIYIHDVRNRSSRWCQTYRNTRIFKLLWKIVTYIRKKLRINIQSANVRVCEKYKLVEM